jgi:hypothetical protein
MPTQEVPAGPSGFQPTPLLRAAACAECGREFQSHAQYLTSRGAVICRDVDGCGERQFAERFADRGVR